MPDLVREDPYSVANGRETASLDKGYSRPLHVGINTLLTSGAIIPQQTQPGYYIDSDKLAGAVLSLEEVIKVGAEQREAGAEVCRPKVDLTRPDILWAYRESLLALRRSELIPGSLMGQVARIIKPSDVVITDAAFAQYLHIEDTFPERGGPRGFIALGLRSIDGRFSEVADVAEKVGLTLSEHQLIHLALRLLISHEYGHAVHDALLIMKIEATLASTGRPDFLNVVIESHRDFNNDVGSRIAPNEKLAGLLGGWDTQHPVRKNDPSHAVSERIAVGFQDIGVEECLRGMGVDEKQIDTFLGFFRDRRARLVVETREILQNSRIRGLDLELLSGAVDRVVYLTRNEHREFAELFTGGFGARVFGYYFPLSRDEIRAMVSR